MAYPEYCYHTGVKAADEYADNRWALSVFTPGGVPFQGGGEDKLQDDSLSVIFDLDGSGTFSVGDQVVSSDYAQRNQFFWTTVQGYWRDGADRGRFRV